MKAGNLFSYKTYKIKFKYEYKADNFFYYYNAG